MLDELVLVDLALEIGDGVGGGRNIDRLCRPMPETRLNPTREKRIIDEIVVDCYSVEERAMGWYYYLEGKFSFPFTARCIAARSVSPLKRGEKAEVVAVAREEDCLAEMFVLVAFAGPRVGVPLAQLKAMKADRAMWLTTNYAGARLAKQEEIKLR